jgi:hypothetical protein
MWPYWHDDPRVLAVITRDEELAAAFADHPDPDPVPREPAGEDGADRHPGSEAG